MHNLISEACELEEHSSCDGTVFCEECAPQPKRPCVCPCGHLDISEDSE